MRRRGLKSAAQLAALAKGVRERHRKTARFARLSGCRFATRFYVMAEAMTHKATAKAAAKAKAAGSRGEAARPAVTGIEKPKGKGEATATAGRGPSVVYSLRMTSLLLEGS
jgi:hypothetical protein